MRRSGRRSLIPSVALAALVALTLAGCGGDDGESSGEVDRASVEASVRTTLDACANVATATGDQKEQAREDLSSGVDELVSAYEENPDAFRGAGVGRDSDSPSEVLDGLASVVGLCSESDADRLSGAAGAG